MQVYKIKNYPDYELHYSDEVQLVYSLKSEKYLKIKKDKYGYIQIGLYKNGKRKWFKIHRLVWMCINGDIPQDFQINHKDENKENNSIENLELVTAKENCNHGTRNQRRAKALSKPIVAVKKDLSEILHYPSAKEAESDQGFKHSYISKCCLNKYKSAYGYIWFFKDDFEEYMKRFNNDLEKVIEYKKSISKK